MKPLVLPWPPPILNPNGRPNHFALAKAKKSYRRTCHILALAAGRPHFPPEGEIAVHLVFCPPDCRKRDDDNFEAAFKSGRDGIAAAWGVDDARFRVTRELAEPVKGGEIIFRLMDGAA